jgi:hypothetical protein
MTDDDRVSQLESAPSETPIHDELVTNPPCSCDVGAQFCLRHLDHLWTKERKIQFRKWWDTRAS